MIPIASVQSSAAIMQAALGVLSTLQLTAHLGPEMAILTNRTSFDFIVLGGGAAGSIVASRLTESGKHSVLLVEAGGDPEIEATIPATFPYVLGTDADWVFMTEKTHHSAELHSTNGIYYPAGKMLGGSGSMFLHFHTRADPAYYDNWAATLNDSSWSYNSLLPYFIKSENVHDSEIMSNVDYSYYHGTDGPIGLTRFAYKETDNYLRAFAELGNRILLDKNGLDSVGYILPLFEIVNETVQHPGRVYLTPAKDRPNLHVLKNTLATKIIFDEFNAATAVEVLDSSNKRWVFKATKEIVVSTGAIKTPQLLMLSGIGPKKHLESFKIKVISDLPVGQEYQDLFGVLLAHQMKPNNESTTISSAYQPGPIIVGFPSLNKSQSSYPDYLTENFILSAGENTSAVYCSFYLGFKEHVCQEYLKAQATHDLMMTFLVKLDPKSRGKILLRSTDPHDYPLIKGGFLNNMSDYLDLVEYIKDFAPVVNTKYFKSVKAKFVKPYIRECKDRSDSFDYWSCYVPRMLISIFKYMSTCPMGKVVDTELKVKNVSRLRVVDASVFPTATRAHPMASVAMIAEKASEMILRDAA